MYKLSFSNMYNFTHVKTINKMHKFQCKITILNFLTFVKLNMISFMPLKVFYGSIFNSSIQFSITYDHHYYSMPAI